jgi:hypothetical protein
MIRFGGLFPPIHVQADIRRTRLLGVTHAPREGGVMMVRSRDDIYRMQDLAGKKIGLSRSQNTIKTDFDVKAWAAPEFLEQAAKELLEQQWKKTTIAKLPEATELLSSGQRIG